MKRSRDLHELLPLALTLLAAGALGPVAAAQAPPAARFEEQVEVREVLLDVLVTDPQGNVVVGLGKDDFAVREDGKQMPVESVTFYSNRRFLGTPEEAKRRGIDLAAVPEERFFVLFFHDQREAAHEAPGLLARQLDAARRASEWVRQDLAPGDWVAVLSYDRKLKVHADFSKDRAALARAIDDAALGKDPGGNWPSRQPAAGAGPSLLARLPAGNELRDRTTTIQAALSTLATALAPLRGRKNLLLFTTGFGELNAAGQYVPDQRLDTPMMQALNSQDVAVYALDLTPVGTEHVLSNAMSNLASETGGRYLYDLTNYLVPLEEIAKDTSGYYLLSYTARHPQGRSGYQEVKVGVRNPEFRVRARGGYSYGGGS